MSSANISSAEEIIADIAVGRMVILMDDEGRENEGDLIMAAEFVTPAAINFMVSQGRGLVCLPLTRERCERLRLPQMVGHNTANLSTAFTVSIEAARGVTTGISAADRAATVQAAIADDASGFAASQSRKVDRCFGMTGANEYAPGFCGQGENVTGHHDVLRAGVIGNGSLNRRRAVGGGNAGGDTAGSLDRDRERGT